MPSQANAAHRVKQVKKYANQFARGRVAKPHPKNLAERMDVRIGRVIGAGAVQAVG